MINILLITLVIVIIVSTTITIKSAKDVRNTLKDIEVYFNPDPNYTQYEVWIPIKKSNKN